MTSAEKKTIFAQWLKDHESILHKVARSFSPTRADQDDLIQEMQVALWHGIAGFDQRSKISSYIYRIALNKAISWKRRAKAHQRKVENFEQEARSRGNEPEQDRRLAIVYAEIRRLNDAERSLILLQFDGFNYREIAETLGLTESNVGVKLNRIRKKLAERLKGQNP